MLPNRIKATVRSDRAFTLLELVVVVAITGLLLVLAISAHAKPRNRVYLTTDASNHRRLMQGMISYAADHNDLVPDAWSNTGNTIPVWAYGTNIALGAFQTVYPLQLAALTNGQIFPYVQDSRVYVCPAESQSDPRFRLRQIFVISYVWNASVSGYGKSYPTTYKLSQFRPDDILEWEANGNNTGDFNDSATTPQEGVSRRHGDNVVIGMFGGGVGTMPITTFYSVSFNPSKNRLWCSPGSANGH